MPEQPKTKPTKPFIDALNDFLSMTNDRSQGVIIEMFVEQIIKHSDVCAQGSVLRHVAPATTADSGVLVVYATDINVNTDVKEIHPETKIPADEGIAGLTFKKREPEYAPDARKHPQYKEIPGQNIGAMYCVPIKLPDLKEPFGVVAFHNPVNKNDKPQEIDRDRLVQMDVAVKALQAALAQSPHKLMDKDRVFMVHGRDQRLREELQKILKKAGIESVVIQSLARTGQDLLSFLEDKIRDCVAGFVLLTPDDEGRLYAFGEPMRLRARQNVVFEGGYLSALFRGTQRVCFLQHGDLEIPSDLNGLLMERFTDHIDPERILLTLDQWGLRRDANGVVKRSDGGDASDEGEEND